MKDWTPVPPEEAGLSPDEISSLSFGKKRCWVGKAPNGRWCWQVGGTARTQDSAKAISDLLCNVKPLEPAALSALAPKDAAALVAKRLSDEELDALFTLLDGDANGDFLAELSIIDARRNPHNYRLDVGAVCEECKNVTLDDGTCANPECSQREVT